MKNLKLLQKILILIIIAAVIPLTIISVFSTLSARNREKEIARNEMSHVLEFNNELINNFFITYEYLVDYLESTPQIKATLKKETDITDIMQIFELSAKSYSEIVNVYFGAERLEDFEKNRGLIVYPVIDDLPDTYDPRTRAWYTAAKANPGTVMISDPYVDVATNEKVISAAKTISDNGKILGVVAIDFNINELANKLLSKKFGKEGKTFILNANKEYILHSDNELVGIYLEESEFIRQLDGAESVFSVKMDDKNYVVQSMKNKYGWYLVTMASRDNVNEKANHQMWLTIIISASITVFAIFFGFFISNRYIRKPILRMSTVITEFGNGNLQNKVDWQSNDEIGQISDTLNNSIDGLKHLVLSLTDASDKISLSAGSLTSVAEQQSASSEELVSQAEEVERNLQNASASVEEVNAGVEEVAGSAQNVSKTTQRLSAEIDLSNKAVKGGQEQLANQNRMLEEVRSNTEITTNLVGDVANKSDSVQGIVTTIASIAEQTNLLALNAAIEAARAGEAGKGFAVVADEIRKLAEESRSSSESIAKILNEIDSGADKANHSVKTIAGLFEQLTDGSAVIAKGFEDIMNAMNNVTAIVDDLSDSAEQQSAASQEMASAMDTSSRSIVDITEQMAEISGATEQQNSASQQISESAEELSELSEKLTENIKHFKI